ncbi:MAG: LPS export ABC transporter periplasmic protein LptC [Aquincola sp.]|nr:LPS export ABC transporter periplasmic protein LptC [Aquincola sp.]MDH4287403.1 LPS export ABC transporter periplasmic protein LptC [Aquincola sp.]MDH5329630.1 LPS export ABC transporter periplasmic protein LptC [Aquincola sp.]
MAIDLDNLIQPLDPLPASGRQSPPARPHLPWWWRIGQWISAYLPVVLMALLALATWWLVRITPPVVEPARAGEVRHEPDYQMQGVTLQRFSPDGRLEVVVRGTQMRHYPDTDTLEIDGVTIRALGAEGAVTVATARLAVANGDASEVQLQGGARVIQEGATPAQQIEFESEFLHAFLTTEKLRSHMPVRVRQGSSELRVATLDYDNLTRTARFGGPVRARIELPK